jgi:DNA-binding beta-propeller fold protein YncE
VNLRRTSLSILSGAAGLAASLLVGCSSANHAVGEGGSGTTTTTTTTDTDPSDFLTAPSSCAYACPNAACPEQTTPYACPAARPWAAIPHEDACDAWDGSYPMPVAGKCTAGAPTGAALARTGTVASMPGVRILPDGRPIVPAGSEWPFDETTESGGETSGIALVPGTSFAVTIDTGTDDHAVRVVDSSQIGKADPVKGLVVFKAPDYLNSGVAVLPSGRVYVATGYGVIQALDINLTNGTLTRNDAASITMPMFNTLPWYASGVAAAPDGKHLVVSSVTDSHAFVLDIDPASSTNGQPVGNVDLGQKETFGAWFDPHDPTGHYAYVSVWGGYEVVEIDVTTPSMPRVNRTFKTDKNPEGVAFLDARWMVVANDYGETISVVDRTTATVTAVPVMFGAGEKGLDVSGVTWDEQNHRLYATLAGIDALAAFDVDLTQTPPTFTPAGRLPTSWWPSGAVVHADGSLTVSNLRGHPIGAFPIMGGGDGHSLMKGSVEQIPAPTAADLGKGDTQVQTSAAVGGQPGYPLVTCPSGTMDFPVPPTNTQGASSILKHVFFIVRENKTFDSLLGDIPGVDGDPSVMMKNTTAEMDSVWTNFRALARTFTVSDNFYTEAVQSTQGHHWTTYGRATDFCERTWSDNLRPVPLCGISDVGRPPEGSLFEWIQGNHLVYTIFGEIVGNPQVAPTGFNPIDISYPGGPIQNISYNDLEKACYAAGRLRVACNLGSFVYMTLPNDHTIGVSPTNPTPDTMCAVNDEATGLFLDALSHSPTWASSLVIITEDDPQAGGDHIDYHRTPLVLISPWVKRAYVSQTHIDVPALHKIFAHVFGLPYNNLEVANAGIPFDAFTSTPDYSPYTYKPHSIPLACGTQGSRAEQRLTESWDFSRPDEQPGLGDQVFRWMRGRQLQELTPEMERQIEERKARRAAGIAERDEDD